ncbi:MAG: 5-carboxymethyl-2-hydroxymuconate Delta-isomerase [Gammaproteobacteria bacterium]|nr:5-carboxymethyl-2-hydroxymuconate Delta-isomerase [Gammaproteobacteria bacterium]
MPHIIIEYSEDLVPDSEIEILVDSLHQTAIDSGLFEAANVKTRAIPVKHYRIANGEGGFIHLQCRIHVGRNDEQKKSLSHSLLDVMKQRSLNVEIITVEVVDMDKGTYARHLA